MKQNNSYRPSVSRSDIEKYREGDEKLRRSIEGDADNFDQDALDGWKESGAGLNQAMKRADRKFRKKSTAPFAIITLLVAASATAIFLSIRNNKNIETVKSPAVVQIKIEKTDLAIAPSIDSMTVLPEAKQIKVETIKISQKEIEQQPVSVPITDVREIPTEILPQKPAELKTPEKTISSQKSAKEIYHDGLKLIDYTLYRAKPVIETEQQLLTGTPADQETKSGSQTEVTIAKVDIPYMDYVKKTAKYVNRGKWKEALQRLDIILKTYPDDVNAHFYAGLCSYNLQQFESATEHFKTCLQLPFNNFNEEASWYLAQSLWAKGEKSQARELLVVIRDQKGYYSKQAEKALKEMK